MFFGLQRREKSSGSKRSTSPHLVASKLLISAVVFGRTAASLLGNTVGGTRTKQPIIELSR